jgi:hypothetical protein
VEVARSAGRLEQMSQGCLERARGFDKPGMAARRREFHQAVCESTRISNRPRSTGKPGVLQVRHVEIDFVHMAVAKRAV